MKVVVADTNTEQSVPAMRMSSSDEVKNHRVEIKCVAGKVYILEQEDNTVPTCQTVINEGYPLEVNDVAVMHDEGGNPKLSQFFVACATGSGELRTFC
jgi:hypothetical protein